MENEHRHGMLKYKSGHFGQEVDRRARRYQQSQCDCLVYKANYSGVWTTAQTGDDFLPTS
jgi:hypothetical protein